MKTNYLAHHLQGTCKLTMAEINHQAKYHTGIEDLIYKGLNVAVIKVFLATKKKRKMTNLEATCTYISTMMQC